MTNIENNLKWNRKDLANKLTPVELERAITTVAYLEDLYGDVHKYLHKLNRILKKPILSISPVPHHLHIIANNLENIQILLIATRNDADYLEVKEIMKGGKYNE